MVVAPLTIISKRFPNRFSILFNAFMVGDVRSRLEMMGYPFWISSPNFFRASCASISACAFWFAWPWKKFHINKYIYFPISLVLRNFDFGKQNKNFDFWLTISTFGKTKMRLLTKLSKFFANILIRHQNLNCWNFGDEFQCYAKIFESLVKKDEFLFCQMWKL